MAIIAKIMGGLGNQMFQYALARRLADQLNTDLFLDNSYYQINNHQIQSHPFCIHEFDIKFDVPIGAISLNLTLYQEKSLSYDENVLNINDNTFLVGYWQNLKYVAPIKNRLIRDFIPKNLNNMQIIQAINFIKSFSNPTVVHVRGDDYIKSPIYSIVNRNYYEKAIKLLVEKVTQPTLFIFSDDDSYVAHLLNDQLQKYGLNAYRIKFSPPVDIYLMSLCKYFIIPNSSFSWWGSFLSQQEGFTIAPNRWLNNDNQIDLRRPDMINIELTL